MFDTLVTQLHAIPDGKERHLAAGTFLFYQGDEVESLFLVLSGEIHLVRHQPDGSSITLQRGRAGGILAEASLYSRCYHCHATAQKAATVQALPRQAVLARLQADCGFAQNWMAYLAQEVQQARFRSELLSLKTVAARLEAWLNWRGGGLPPKGEWKTLAEQLGVSPEALYREIARRS
ncbi:Crp/Fnr family transcriptional regulator [Thiothrix winogradskyi]|uniref:Crp/Fnr family transcriptional regulator n=1 Tax=Thiothrix winogradskyi TaxID=96472 RepID=A0ABY3T545_9GAMM|nr:Crp/Fnr family transcriptional regulator [Thiothrix winogradskyi]UJS26339.1 Crp/Fnr family transcriptional regulator [Thiothrix winogradskyi]